MTSEGLGEMFEDDSADTCSGKIPLTLMGVRASGMRYFLLSHFVNILFANDKA